VSGEQGPARSFEFDIAANRTASVATTVTALDAQSATDSALAAPSETEATPSVTQSTTGALNVQGDGGFGIAANAMGPLLFAPMSSMPSQWSDLWTSSTWLGPSFDSIFNTYRQAIELYMRDHLVG